MLQDDPHAASQDKVSNQWLEDQWLVEQARQGDQMAADTLFDRYYEDIYRYLYLQWHLSADEARDLSQEVFVKAWNGLSGLQRSFSFASWLRSIARNVARDALRSRRRRIQPSSFDPDFDVIDRNSSPEERVILTDLFERALRDMSEPRRTCLRRSLSGLKPEAIARELNLSEGTVRTYISQARKDLRAALTGQQTPSQV
jgi:RNA polymerase sigma-70 factor (ECF subfamily)